MGEFAGPFLGFTFDDIHSSELNIVRVANSNRYTNNLAPDIQDITVAVPNGDGVYYFGSTYGKRTFTINIAFDSLTEKELVKLRRTFNEKGLHRLAFDETPYKCYIVKITGAPNLTYVPFEIDFDEPQDIIRKADLYGYVDEDFYEGAYRTENKGRIYKGEGNIQFTAFEPYAHSTYKYKDELYRTFRLTTQRYTNYDSSVNIGGYSEWFDSYDWISSTYAQDNLQIDHPGTTGCVVYNAGDIETPFIYKLYSPSNNVTLSLADIDKSLSIENVTLQGSDAGYQINMKLHLIEGIDSSGQPTGIVYNQYIIGGDFFNLPTMTMPMLLTTTGVSASNQPEIHYDYLYY